MNRWTWPCSALMAPGAAAGPLLVQQAPMTVETVTVVARALDKVVSIPGDLSAYQAVNIHAQVSGFVESVAVDRGSWVKRVQAVRAQQAEAQARMIAAVSTAERLKAASATPGVVAGNDLEVAERAAEALRAQVEALKSSGSAAEAAARAVAELEGHLQLTAPFEGVVTERQVHPGSLVSQSSGAMLRIEQTSRLRLTVPVPETYVAAIAKGRAVDFTVAAFPDQTFQGTIARPALSLDIRTRSMLVELDVANGELTLAPGMFAEVRWPVSRAGKSLFVPASAVVRTSERQFVVRVRNGVAEWLDVRRGEMSDGAIEVFGHLQEGDVIVRRGNDEIRHGTRVSPAAAKS